MQLGVHLRELWSQKMGLAIAVVLAFLALARVLFGISVFPPGIQQKSLGLASASTEVVVDTPRSSVVDLREDTYSYIGLTNRALLLGNVMASIPVRAFIARRAEVPPAEIRVTPPVSAEQPNVVTDAANQPRTSDILKSPEEYRLSIQSNPSVPVLNIYAEAPDGESASRLANAAVDGLRDYLGSLSREHATPRKEQVRLVQLGRASGGVIDRGVKIQLAVLVFLVVLAVCCAAVLFLSRVRRGWAEADALERRQARDLG
jgi:hypothetical protein